MAAVYSRDLDAGRQLFYALFGLQHRGQESSGIATSNGRKLHLYKRMGLVAQVFTEQILMDLPGTLGIGHNRYSTTGASADCNAQPFLIKTKRGSIAVAHNGNLVNYSELLTKLKTWGVQLNTEDQSDSSLITSTVAYFYEKSGDLPKAASQAFDHLRGSFSLVMMDHNQVVGLRDRHGLRPLCLGTLGPDRHIIVSESCALGPLEASFEREIAPGEMIAIGPNGLESHRLAEPDPKYDLFEFIYTARPDSILAGRSVYQVRKRFGIQLALEYFPEADIVIPIPDTGIPVATGYAQATGLPFEEGLIKSRYVHRTFIEPDPHTRHNKVRMKLTPLKSVIAGKRVILIDDSIVRGTTSKQLVNLVKEAGAKEVHFLISSPPIKYPDFYGIDIPTGKELIASEMSTEEIARYVGATSLHYLSMEGAIKAVGLPASHLNAACFTGEYPVWPEQLGTPTKAGSAKAKA